MNQVLIPDKVWIGYDWKQAELYFLSLFSGDTVLREALLSSDVHRYVASRLFQKDMKDVNSKDRDLAKITSYGLIYSGFDIHTTSANIIRENPSLKEEEVEVVLNRYQEEFFQLFNWVGKTLLNWYDNNGIVYYFLGAPKQIPIPEYLPREVDKLRTHKSGRTAINTFGQNSVGLLLKCVYNMMFKDEEIREHTCQHIPIFDSMNFLCDAKNLHFVVQKINRFSTPILRHNGFEIQMRTEWKSSIKSWGDMKEVSIPPSEKVEEPIIYEW